MSNAEKLLESVFGEKRCDDDRNASGMHYGILHTNNYLNFIILNDIGTKIFEFNGAKLANKCLPGDHVIWDGSKCILELRDEYPLIVGTIELTNKSKYGMTSRGIPIYLFTPHSKRYPNFIVGCSEKDTTKNRIGLIKFDTWADNSTFPRGQLQQTLGVSGEYEAEKMGLIWDACPWKYPKYDYNPRYIDNCFRVELSGYTFNIDPSGCKDVDDVFTFEECEKGWKVTISISDVASYIEDGSAIDILASLIGQTLYDTDGTVLRPMLPKEYSEEVCSLKTEKDSYGISLQFIWNGEEIRDIVWFESILRVNKSYIYEEFEECNVKYKKILKDISSYMGKREINDSHEWVEQMMIFYNNEAGKLLKSVGTGILRRHNMPDMEKLVEYKDNIPELEKLAFSSAEYCLADEDNTCHFGLNSEHYCHSTSPIRRYADLVNQRILKLIINKQPINYIVPQATYDMNLREKAIKNYGRNIEFLNAIKNGRTEFKGIIVETKIKDILMKVKIYIPEWKRIISTHYLYNGENTVLSRDEKKAIDITKFREVVVRCAFNSNIRKWKDRVIINIE
jgi:exoribonuclease R